MALCLAGIVLTALLVARKVPGAIVFGMLVITVAGLLPPNGAGGQGDRPLRRHLRAPHSAAPVFLEAHLRLPRELGEFQAALPLIFTLLLVDMFDNIGTLIGVTKRAGLLDSEGRLPQAGRALLADSIATILSRPVRHLDRRQLHRVRLGRRGGRQDRPDGHRVAVFMLLALFLTPLILAVPPARPRPRS